MSEVSIWLEIGDLRVQLSSCGCRGSWFEIEGVMGPGFKIGGCLGCRFEIGGVLHPGLKTRGVVGPKNSTDGGI